MSIFKCKMCGGTLEIQNNETVAICEYCGTKQTLPRLDDEKRANLYDRANHFRRNNEFDKAAAIYEQILSEDGKDAEAYWSLVLCRYGIEYVEDPATRKRVPTVNRAQFTSIYADADYQAALEHADGYQRTVYEEEAKAIDEIQKGILAISQKEEPFDVFICYKETDNNGRRTPDSVLANDLYHQLTQEGFKVFFARITLEDKLGSAYEPYIFAALNSAKVMVVLGTKPEYFNAVWVKNEWSRFLALTKDGKKTLIPAYKDMDPYYLPPEFANLQAQDMSKLGFMQDLIRGIKKLVEKDDTQKAPSAMPVNPDNPILARAFLFAENRDWAHANEYFEKALDSNPYDGEAYVGKLLVELQISKREELANCAESFENNNNYQMAKRYASPALLAELDGYTAAIQKRQNDAKKEIVYQNAVKMMAKSKGEEDYLAVAHAFRSIFDYKDSVALAEKCEASATAIRNEGVYLASLALSRSKNPVKIQEAADKFASISGYKDAGERLEDCRYRLSGMGVAQSTENGGKRKLFVLVTIAASFLILCIVAVFVVMPLLGDNGNGNPVVALPSDVAESTLEPSAPTFTSTPVKTATPKPTQTPVRTVTPVPTKTPVKTATPVPTKTPVKTATPVSTRTPVKTATPTPTSTPRPIQNVSSNVAVGDIVKFGFYEQDNNTANGQEEIEWIVLEKKAGKALIISKYGLDCQPYNTTYIDVTWETCTLRNWLNTTFYTTAFNVNQQSMIASTTLTNADNPNFGTEGGNNTIDKVFLLSIDEAKQYFASDTARKLTATAYAKAHGAYVASSDSSYWWLRSPGIHSSSAACVYSGGMVHSPGDDVDYVHDDVRPALWINLES